MPSYQSLSVVAKEIGCSIIEYRPSFEEKWAFDSETLKTKITPETRLLILNYPHNPTGACLTDSEMASITALCLEHRLYLIADEVYRFLRMDESCSDTSFADLYENAVALGSFSKTFAAPGLRLGWVATKSPELLHKLLAYRHFTSTCSNLPCQWLASELLMMDFPSFQLKPVPVTEQMIAALGVKPVEACCIVAIPENARYFAEKQHYSQKQRFLCKEQTAMEKINRKSAKHYFWQEVSLHLHTNQ